MTYTEQQIRNMQPGPELDSALAEAFGWEYFIAKLGIVAKKPNEETCHPHFSTTWEGMGLVIEEMQRRGWSVAILTRADGCGVGFVKDGQQYVADSTSAPHAVAMAALLALRGGESG